MGQFREFGDKDVDALLAPPSEHPSPAAERRTAAYRVWVEQQYGDVFDPTSGGPRIPVQAALDFMVARKANRLPSWVVELAPLDKIRATAEGGET